MYGGDPPYGQQPPSGGHNASAPAGGYNYAAPQQQQQSTYGYAPQQPAAAPPSYAGAAGTAYGGYDSGYAPGMGGQESAGGYGRSWGGGGGGYGGGGGGRHHGGGGGGSGGRFAAVRLRGLPFGVREHEVAFFMGLDPVDILLTTRGGRATGEAYVVLAHPSELDIAMRKNKAYMGSRYIEVFEARKWDYYRAVADTVADGIPPRGGRGGPPGSPRDRSRSPPPRRGRDRDYDGYRGGYRGGPPSGEHAPVNTKILKLRGLPFSSGIDQILDFFNDSELGLPTEVTVDDVTIATGEHGRPTGMAFVEFESIEVAEKALKKDRGMMGSRYIELFPASEDERARFLPVTG